MIECHARIMRMTLKTRVNLLLHNIFHRLSQHFINRCDYTTFKTQQDLYEYLKTRTVKP